MLKAALISFNPGLNGLVMDELLLSSKSKIMHAKAYHTVLMMNNLILAWNLKIVLSVLIHCIQLRTDLSEISQLMLSLAFKNSHLRCI